MRFSTKVIYMYIQPSEYFCLNSSCPTYSKLPPECHLEKVAGKCCAEPVCDFNKQFGHFTGSGTTSGKGGSELALLHYENMPMQYTCTKIFKVVKNENFK